MTTDHLWILGATGRVGRAVATALATDGHRLVLCGRNGERLDRVAAGLPDGTVVRTIAGSFEDAVHRLAREEPAVVVNTVGPFAETAPLVLDALAPGVHYVDVSNELPAVQAVFDRDATASAHGSTWVAASGFGVLATESALLTAIGDRGTPASVRVDGIASVASEDGVVGDALAHSIVDGLGAPGSEVRDGVRVRARLGGSAETMTTPDGDRVTTGGFPSGDLLAAWRVSGAARVVSASAFVPTGTAAAIAVGAIQLLARIPGVTRFIAGRVAVRPTRSAPRPRTHSWARGRAVWADGTSRTAWFRADDAMDFTVAAVAQVAGRLARGEGRPGAWTPGGLFGPDVAETAGASFVLE